MTTPEGHPIQPERLVHDDDFITPPEIERGQQIGTAMINDAGILLTFYEFESPQQLGGSRVEAFCGKVPSGSYFPEWIIKIGDGSYNKGISTIMLDYYANVTREMVREGEAKNVCWFANLPCYRKISE